VRTILTSLAIVVLAVFHGQASGLDHLVADDGPLEIVIETNECGPTSAPGATRSTDCREVAHELASNSLHLYFSPLHRAALLSNHEACLSSPPAASLQACGVRWQI